MTELSLQLFTINIINLNAVLLLRNNEKRSKIYYAEIVDLNYLNRVTCPVNDSRLPNTFITSIIYT